VLSGGDAIKLSMFAAMAPDLMRYLGVDDTVYDIGCKPTCFAAGAKCCTVCVEQRRYNPPGCWQFIAVE
jgi:hypothetical protein